MRRETRETGIPRRRGYSPNGETRETLLRDGYKEVSEGYFESDRGSDAYIGGDGVVHHTM